MATTILPATLTQLSKTANIIFYGKVIGNQVKLDTRSGRVATFTEFEVIEPIKGNISTRFQIKQVGGQIPGSNIVHKVPGVPKFSVGQEYIVFLPTASKSGFSSPIGLEQGRYSVYEKNGIKMINRNFINEETNRAARPTSDDSRVNSSSLQNFIQSVREQIK